MPTYGGIRPYYDRREPCSDCGRYARCRAVRFMLRDMGAWRACATCHRSYGSAVHPPYRRNDR